MNNEVQNFWDTVKIKELPVKDEIDKKSVLLIEDDEDTKQMSISKFYDAIERLANDMVKTIRAKLVEVDSFMESMKLKDAEYAANEELRQSNERKRMQDEQERREQFEEWERIWNMQWTPFYNATVERENIRIANEQYRIEEFNRWTAQITQWEKDEAERKRQENIRINNENDRISEFNIAITDCRNATTNCINVTNRLDNMFEIGSSVPSSLPTQKVYFQYF